MQPTSPHLVFQDGEPNVELLRRLGWSIGTFAGSYCVAWRGRDEVVFEWKADGWHPVSGRGALGDL
jgi:hypothetical protein